MTYLGINHVGLVVTDLSRSREFFIGALGLHQHTRRATWFIAGRCTLHLIEIPEAGDDRSLYRSVQHVALQVDDLNDMLAQLLHAGLAPFQLDFEGNEMPVDDPASPLEFGVGTLFVRDPDGNLIELIQLGRGIFKDEPDPFAA